MHGGRGGREGGTRTKDTLVKLGGNRQQQRSVIRQAGKNDRREEKCKEKTDNPGWRKKGKEELTGKEQDSQDQTLKKTREQ